MPIFKGATLADSAPPDVAASSAVGTSLDMAREDHTHGHGNQAGGSLHADVIAGGASGFMSGTDKTKLNGIATGATNTPLGSSTPAIVVRDFVGGSAGVSSNAAREDHVHAEDPKTVYIDTEQTYDPSTRQTFGPELSGKCGLNVGQVGGSPVDLINGDIWYDSVKHLFQGYVNGAVKDIQTDPTSPGGSSGEVQFNSGGAFAGSANLTWDGTDQLVVGNTASVGLPSAPAVRIGTSNTGLYTGGSGEELVLAANGQWIANAVRGAVAETSYLRLNDGNIPATTTPASNALYEKNLIKCWGRITTTGGGAVNILDGFNITSCTISGSSVLVTFNVDMANANYMALAIVHQNANEHATTSSHAVGTLLINLWDADAGVQFNLSSTSRAFSFLVIGVQ